MMSGWNTKPRLHQIQSMGVIKIILRAWKNMGRKWKAGRETGREAGRETGRETGREWRQNLHSTKRHHDFCTSVLDGESDGLD